eukprot:TRINITY_DN22557_c0_g1_i2.p1 TRINITY_DN22557_c0_g1~~TRINITY_DN22557_c0_g1_i2.p1  ORF type:complete len:767 (+),score=86.45 TRINITY_DN22557_c0_g1_i2:26-2326(+)
MSIHQRCGWHFHVFIVVSIGTVAGDKARHNEHVVQLDVRTATELALPVSDTMRVGHRPTTNRDRTEGAEQEKAQTAASMQHIKGATDAVVEFNKQARTAVKKESELVRGSFKTEAATAKHILKMMLKSAGTRKYGQQKLTRIGKHVLAGMKHKLKTMEAALGRYAKHVQKRVVSAAKWAKRDMLKTGKSVKSFEHKISRSAAEAEAAKRSEHKSSKLVEDIAHRELVDEDARVNHRKEKAIEKVNRSVEKSKTLLQTKYKKSSKALSRYLASATARADELLALKQSSHRHGDREKMDAKTSGAKRGKRKRTKNEPDTHKSSTTKPTKARPKKKSAYAKSREGKANKRRKVRKTRRRNRARENRWGRIKSVSTKTTARKKSSTLGEHIQTTRSGNRKKNKKKKKKMMKRMDSTARRHKASSRGNTKRTKNQKVNTKTSTKTKKMKGKSIISGESTKRGTAREHEASSGRNTKRTKNQKVNTKTSTKTKKMKGKSIISGESTKRGTAREHEASSGRNTKRTKNQKVSTTKSTTRKTKGMPITSGESTKTRIENQKVSTTTSTTKQTKGKPITSGGSTKTSTMTKRPKRRAQTKAERSLSHRWGRSRRQKGAKHIRTQNGQMAKMRRQETVAETLSFPQNAEGMQPHLRIRILGTRRARIGTGLKVSKRTPAERLRRRPANPAASKRRRARAAGKVRKKRGARIERSRQKVRTGWVTRSPVHPADKMQRRTVLKSDRSRRGKGRNWQEGHRRDHYQPRKQSEPNDNAEQ